MHPILHDEYSPDPCEVPTLIIVCRIGRPVDIGHEHCLAHHAERMEAVHAWGRCCDRTCRSNGLIDGANIRRRNTGGEVHHDVPPLMDCAVYHTIFHCIIHADIPFRSAESLRCSQKIFIVVAAAERFEERCTADGCATIQIIASLRSHTQCSNDICTQKGAECQRRRRANDPGSPETLSIVIRAAGVLRERRASRPRRAPIAPSGRLNDRCNDVHCTGMPRRSHRSNGETVAVHDLRMPPGPATPIRYTPMSRPVTVGTASPVPLKRNLVLIGTVMHPRARQLAPPFVQPRTCRDRMPERRCGIVRYPCGPGSPTPVRGSRTHAPDSSGGSRQPRKRSNWLVIVNPAHICPAQELFYN